MGFQSSVPQKKLGAALKAARSAAGLSTYKAGPIITRDQSTVSRIESGKAALTPQQLAKFVQAYGIDEDTHRELLQLLENSQGGDEWWRLYRWALSGAYLELIENENEASHLITINALVIPGLLQTRNYCTALLLKTTLLADPDRAEAHVEARVMRQQRLDDDKPLTLHAFVPEHVMDYQYGDDQVHLEQLVYLRQMCDHPRVTFRAVRAARMVDMYPVDLYEFSGNNPPVAYSETLSSSVYERGLDLRRLRRMIAAVGEAASSPEETVEMIDARIAGIRRRQ